MNNHLPLFVNWGGGVNSTALLIGLWERDIKPESVIFADTGGEKPETYAYLETFNAWLVSHGFPSIITVRNDGMYESLEDNCLKKNTLPSIAFGFRSCSDKYKRRPIEKFEKAFYPGQRIRKAIGYDAGETRRATWDETKRYVYWFPLIEWGWDRERCIEAIERAGLAVPVKSACFYCPSSKKAEIVQLSKAHPDLFARAVAMERNADLTTIKGLGRRFSWEAFIKGEQEADDLQPSLPCMCSDGEDE